MRGVRLSERARKFLREVGSIVLGVLIALGIGEVADDLRWQARAAKSEKAMNEELALAAGVLEERAIVQPCLDRRVAEVKARIDTAWQTGALPDIPVFGGAPERPLQTAAWADAIATGTLTHLSDRSRTLLSLNYPLLVGFNAAIEQENDLWSAVHVIIDKPGPVPRSLLVEASSALNKLYVRSLRNGTNARQIKHDLDSRGIKPDYLLVLDRKGVRRDVVALARERPICRPLARLMVGRR